eukprot:NODE_259_length_3271_cov_12.554389.p1 GENE.NODE_259_length_3271_cov_12.554389~~NODE_259_length_3271_cov_12.554389.p1  ORF type:complete len:877 (-),score=245.33 NODE_259_length_3271_cov_12.554389:243-2873(-)
MSADPVILKILANVCEEDLQLFEKVALKYNNEVPECFLCIGKHNLFFVKKNMNTLLEELDGKLSYLDIENGAIDLLTNRVFRLQLCGEAFSSWGVNTQLLIASRHRQQLLERIGLCWQAEAMYRRMLVKRFPLVKISMNDEAPDLGNLQVQPPKGYTDCEEYTYKGYGFYLRTGFKDPSLLATGNYIHSEGWEVDYAGIGVTVPPGVQVTVHINDLMPITELERRHKDDLRTVASQYKQALVDHLDQFYVVTSCAYMKKMNRRSDIAAWDGWELFIRSKHFAFACIILRREYIPPLCDMAQDIAVLLRCGAQKQLNHTTCEVLLDEARFVADSLASTSDVTAPNHVYRLIIQARLDALQFNEDAFRFLEGQLGLVPVHKKPAAMKFVKSIAYLLKEENQLKDIGLLDLPEFEGISVLKDPMTVFKEMAADVVNFVGQEDTDERKVAWNHRVARYLAYCVDGGIVGDRFSLQLIISASNNCSLEADRTLHEVIDQLLDITPVSEALAKELRGMKMPISTLLQTPEEFLEYSFNDRVMRTLLMESYLRQEYRKRRATASDSEGAGYEKLLAQLSCSAHVSLSLRTLLCRIFLDMNTSTSNEGDDQAMQVIVPALIQILEERNTSKKNLSLISCATAALVNLSCRKMSTKTLLISSGCARLCIQQLKEKDDDLTLYSLYLLVNLTKTPFHRSIAVSHGAVPLLVDVLTSSYQNARKQKILAEVASILGQLCNDLETRAMISEDYVQALPCLLWIFNSALPNTTMKAKLLFTLRQFCGVQMNRIKVGQHVISPVLDDLGMGSGTMEGQACVTNAILLLTTLATIHSNATKMGLRLDESLKQCGLMGKDNTEAPRHKFSPNLWEKVEILKAQLQEATFAMS